MGITLGVHTYMHVIFIDINMDFFFCSKVKAKYGSDDEDDLSTSEEEDEDAEFLTANLDVKNIYYHLYKRRVCT